MVTTICKQLQQVAVQRRLDLTYWLFFTPIVTGGITRSTTVGAAGLLTLVAARPTLSLGIWIELPLALLLADLVGYWSHRLRHRPALWQFHAIHHSPTELDALAAARMHPVDDVIDNTIVGIVLFVTGFSMATIFAVGPILFAHIALTHANVAWDFGRLRKIFVSPAHHRAHHEIGSAKNFAGMFSFIDIVFGSYRETSRTASGRAHGSGEQIPDSLRAHLLWPLRERANGI